jgi:hypothetical protein
MSYHTVYKINCINFPCRVDNFSFDSVKLAAHQTRMESRSGCGRLPPDANLQCEKF